MATFEPLEHFDLEPTPNLQESVLSIRIPNTKRGSLRAASIVDSRICGVRLTEDNCERVLQFAGGVGQNDQKSRRFVREIVHFLLKWDELIAISETDLDYLEESWTGSIHPENRATTASEAVTFYALLEYSTFITNDWDIVKEVSYFAVSRVGLGMLIKTAGYKKEAEILDLMHAKARPCGHQVWRITIECLRHGSPWQEFSAAVTCTLLTLFSLPDRKRLDHCPPTEALGFGYLKRSRLREIVSKLHKMGDVQLAPRHVNIPYKLPAESQAMIREDFARRKDIRPSPEDLTFIRTPRRKQVNTLHQQHSTELCARCLHIKQDYGQDHTFGRTNVSRISDYGMVLVGTLDMTSESWDTHDFCLFTFEPLSEIDGNFALGVVVEDLLQNGHIFFTIRHPFLRAQRFSDRIHTGDTIWNLPQPYRPVTRKQQFECRNWAFELQGQTIPDPPEDAQDMDCWSHL